MKNLFTLLTIFLIIGITKAQETSTVRYIGSVLLKDKIIAATPIMSSPLKGSSDCQEQLKAYIRMEIHSNNYKIDEENYGRSFAKVNIVPNGYTEEKLNKNYEDYGYKITPIDISKFVCKSRNIISKNDAVKWLQSNSNEIFNAKDIKFNDDGINYITRKIGWDDVQDVNIVEFDDNIEQIRILTRFYDEEGGDVFINLIIKDRENREAFLYNLQNILSSKYRK